MTNNSRKLMGVVVSIALAGTLVSLVHKSIPTNFEQVISQKQSFLNKEKGISKPAEINKSSKLAAYSFFINNSHTNVNTTDQKSMKDKDLSNMTDYDKRKANNAIDFNKSTINPQLYDLINKTKTINGNSIMLTSAPVYVLNSNGDPEVFSSKKDIDINKTYYVGLELSAVTDNGTYRQKNVESQWVNIVVTGSQLKNLYSSMQPDNFITSIYQKNVDYNDNYTNEVADLKSQASANGLSDAEISEVLTKNSIALLKTKDNKLSISDLQKIYENYK